MEKTKSNNVSFILKLIVFCVSYYFMLDYIVNCHIHTNVCSIIIFISIVITTFLYLLLTKSI